MKKIKICSIFLIILLLISTFSFSATDFKGMLDNFSSTSNNLVYASSSEVLINSEFYIIFNLSKIEFNEFKVRIINNSDAVTSEVPSQAKNVSVTNNETSFNVNKQSISLDKMAIAYNAPNVESNLNFKIEITDLEDNKSKWENEIKVIEETLKDLNKTLEDLKKDLNSANLVTNEISNSTNTATLQKTSEEIENLIKENETKKEELNNKINNYVAPEKIEETVTIKVITSSEKDPMDDDKMKEKMELDFKDKQMSQMKKMMQQVEDLEGNLKSAKNQISELTSSSKYQGSQNNYLSSLSISGVKFKSDFKKTTLTYFADLESKITSLNINAVPEDSSSTVTIYGNNNLKVGKNKIMVVVTAENGDVKTYKIYVEKKG